ncbi:NAD(P)H-binding protein [Pseudolysinimonas kribbensis]|uniref:NmrA family transcriptional regulator n=1 Tax=Pseudolysinimonas kribbensis TaxID=433641 RepID=A0ABQ6K556_9MICO|nr:NAD(P)H-binding protein [Pseudolysinimonas kribbensis]GMA95758.1 NmrA family transcriptional regulator [Pseudolysinimonas kribbensis]
MRIAVFGANGATGRHVIRQALATDDEIVALVRRPASFPYTGPRLRVVAGDVRDAESVDATVAGADAVLSTIGVPFSRDPIDIYSAAATAVADAMRRHGVRRIAVVSSSAVEAHERTEGWLFERVLQPMVVNGIGRTTYADMRAAEEIVAHSGLDATIVRASGLFPADAVSDYRADTAHAPGAFTSRPDLAHFLLRQAREPEWIGTRPEVHTDDGTPSLLRMIWDEGIRHTPDPILRDPALETV